VQFELAGNSLFFSEQGIFSPKQGIAYRKQAISYELLNGPPRHTGERSCDPAQRKPSTADSQRRSDRTDGQRSRNQWAAPGETECIAAIIRVTEHGHFHYL
jgi:hypothetical protein